MCAPCEHGRACVAAAHACRRSKRRAAQRAAAPAQARPRGAPEAARTFLSAAIVSSSACFSRTCCREIAWTSPLSYHRSLRALSTGRRRYCLSPSAFDPPPPPAAPPPRGGGGGAGRSPSVRLIWVAAAAETALAVVRSEPSDSPSDARVSFFMAAAAAGAREWAAPPARRYRGARRAPLRAAGAPLPNCGGAAAREAQRRDGGSLVPRPRRCAGSGVPATTNVNVGFNLRCRCCMCSSNRMIRGKRSLFSVYRCLVQKRE